MGESGPNSRIINRISKLRSFAVPTVSSKQKQIFSTQKIPIQKEKKYRNLELEDLTGMLESQQILEGICKVGNVYKLIFALG